MNIAPIQDQAEAVRRIRQWMVDAAHLLKQCGYTRTKPLVGGCFGSSGYLLCSQAYEKKGLDAVRFFVMDQDQLVVLGAGDNMADALDSARTLLGYVPDAIANEIIEQRRRTADEDEARAVEWRDRIAARQRAKTPSIPRRRLRIFQKSEGKCHYCATTLEFVGKWHIEHKMPRALMGTDADENLVASCVSCNTKKRDKTDQEFIAERDGRAA